MTSILKQEVPPYVDISGVVTTETDDDPDFPQAADDPVYDNPKNTAKVENVFSRFWNVGNKGGGTTQVRIDVHATDSASSGWQPGRVLYMLLAVVVLSLLAFCLIVAISVFAARGGSNAAVPMMSTTTPKPEVPLCGTPQCMEVGAYMLSLMNDTVDPCRNFYQYACGGFMANSVILPGRYESSIKYNLMQKNTEKIEAVIEDRSGRYTYRAYERKLTNFFLSCLDEYGRTQESTSNLFMTIRDKLGGWYGFNTTILNTWDFNDAFAKAHGDLAIQPLIRWMVAQSVYTRTQNAIRIYYPLQIVPYSQLLRYERYQTAYQGYLQDIGRQLLTDYGISIEDPRFQPRFDNFVNDVYQLDYKIAEAVQRAIRVGRYEKIRLSAITKAQVNYERMFTYTFQASGVTGNTYVELVYKNYTLGLDQILAGLGSNKTRALNNYLVAYFIHNYAQELSPAYRHAYFRFRERSSGYVSRTTIRDDCFTSARSLMTEAVEAEYVKMFFHPTHKDEINNMYNRIIMATDSQIRRTKWMDAATKGVALDKIDTMDEKLGHPDYLLDEDVMDGIYAGLDIRSSYNYFTNLMAAAQYKKIMANNDLTKSVTRDRWSLASYATSAYYHVSQNEVRVAAGMIQFPYYWHQAPAAHRYGGIGTTVAHQVHRAVDEYGNRWYGNGTYARNTWYSSATNTKFQKLRTCLAGQYSELKAGPYDVPGRGTGIMVNIKGDRYPPYAIPYIGALRQTYKAYMAQQEESPDARIPGVETSNAQSFFLAVAQVQCTKRHPGISWSRAQYGAMQEDILLTGALQQMDEFQQAFKCPKDSFMVAKRKCDVIF